MTMCKHSYISEFISQLLDHLLLLGNVAANEDPYRFSEEFYEILLWITNFCTYFMSFLYIASHPFDPLVQ